ncbi:FadR/GntR family transcriptional regulator [Paenibacillus sp. M1]|uniref:FadR/GntR family transcriptional regulator n=1 Tax=Paenibacillus haidiansis TaxID=1574488 RepID=A0ABU7VLY5_9BACL
MNSKLSFEPLNRHRLVDDVVNQLQKRISEGGLQPGDKIPTEPELMEQFGVGRSTIREAVRVLVHAGLLEKRQGFGTYLKVSPVIQEPLAQRLKRAEILEVYEVRKMLELETARLAAGRREEKDLQAMRDCLDRRMAALNEDDMEAYLLADIDFHLSVAVASKNSVAADLFRTFSSVLLDALRNLVKDRNVHDPHVAYHESLYTAILERDADAAEQWTLMNLDGTVQQLKKKMRQD